MPLTFYHVPNSTSSFTETIFAELDHGEATPLAERIILAIRKGETRTPDYLANVNPNGRVPAIVHDGVPIWESAAITMYLGEVFGEKKGLYPALGPQRGAAMKWIVWTNTVLAEAGSRLGYSLPPGTPGGVEEGSQDAPKDAVKEAARAEKEKQARADLEKILGVLNVGLEGREYLLGDKYTLADTHVWGGVGWLNMMGIPLANHPNVQAWLKKVAARPALAGLF